MGLLEDAADNIIEQRDKAEREKAEAEQEKQRLANDPTLPENYRIKISAEASQWITEYINFMHEHSIAPTPCVTARWGEKRTYWFRQTEQVIQLAPIGFAAWILRTYFGTRRFGTTEFAVSDNGWLILVEEYPAEKFSQAATCGRGGSGLGIMFPDPPDYKVSEDPRKLVWQFPEGWPAQNLLLLSRFPPHIHEPSYFSDPRDKSTVEGDVYLTADSGYHYLHQTIIDNMVYIKQSKK